MKWLLTVEVYAGVLDIFEAGEVALGSEGSPTCIVCEAGQYSLAHYMARMERNPSAARQKSTLTQLLEAVSYLHGRSMVSTCDPHVAGLHLVLACQSMRSPADMTLPCLHIVPDSHVAGNVAAYNGRLADATQDRLC